jgi:hypothetical protein
MNFRTTYGTLLKEQLEMYTRMFELLEEITNITNSNVYTQSRGAAKCCAVQMERLAVQLDKTFDNACQSMERIEHMSALCQQILSPPVYLQILEIHILAEAKVNEVKQTRYSAMR